MYPSYAHGVALTLTAIRTNKLTRSTLPLLGNMGYAFPYIRVLCIHVEEVFYPARPVRQSNSVGSTL
jgi:hypothetical protein